MSGVIVRFVALVWMFMVLRISDNATAPPIPDFPNTCIIPKPGVRKNSYKDHTNLFRRLQGLPFLI